MGIWTFAATSSIVVADEAGSGLRDERLRERLREQVADESVVSADDQVELVARVVEHARMHGDASDLDLALLGRVTEAAG